LQFCIIVDSIPKCLKGLSERLRRWSKKPDVVGWIPVTTEFFLISCDSNQVPKLFGAHYNQEIRFKSAGKCKKGPQVIASLPCLIQDEIIIIITYYYYILPRARLLCPLFALISVELDYHLYYFIVLLHSYYTIFLLPLILLLLLPGTSKLHIIMLGIGIYFFKPVYCNRI